MTVLHLGEEKATPLGKQDRRDQSPSDIYTPAVWRKALGSPLSSELIEDCGRHPTPKFSPCRHGAFPAFPGEKTPGDTKGTTAARPLRTPPPARELPRGGVPTCPRRVDSAPQPLGPPRGARRSPGPPASRPRRPPVPSTFPDFERRFGPSAPRRLAGGRGSQVTHPLPERDSGRGRAPGAVPGRVGPGRPPTGSRRARPAAPSRAEATARGDWSCPAAPLGPSGPGDGEEARAREGVDAQRSRARAECRNSGSLAFGSCLMITYLLFASSRYDSLGKECVWAGPRQCLFAKWP